MFSYPEDNIPYHTPVLGRQLVALSMGTINWGTQCVDGQLSVTTHTEGKRDTSIQEINPQVGM